MKTVFFNRFQIELHLDHFPPRIIRQLATQLRLQANPLLLNPYSSFNTLQRLPTALHVKMLTFSCERSHRATSGLFSTSLPIPSIVLEVFSQPLRLQIISLFYFHILFPYTFIAGRWTSRTQGKP